MKQAARLTGVPEATLRTWERRYAVVRPTRTDAGYRLYDPHAIAALTGMRKLVAAGWAPSIAARAIREGSVPITGHVTQPQDDPSHPADPASLVADFLSAAARMDVPAVETSLDRAFSTGSFEHVVDTWLCPALVALGEGWARGEIDVAGEHAASHAVLRRLSAAFEAAGRRSRNPAVVVGLPPGSRHELGALAFATAARRVGLDVMYLGADVPATSWEAAVTAHSAQAAVLAVATAADRPSAAATARRVVDAHPGVLVASGGAFGADLGDQVHALPDSIASAAIELEATLHQSAPAG